MIVGEFGKTKVENFDVPAPRDKDIPGFDIAVDDALGMCSVELFGDLHGKIEEFVEFERFECDAVAQSFSLEKLHREEIPAADFSNLVDRADIGMVQCRGRARFASKSFRGLRVVD
jgi:hypothetical protein